MASTLIAILCSPNEEFPGLWGCLLDSRGKIIAWIKVLHSSRIDQMQKNSHGRMNDPRIRGPLFFARVFSSGVRICVSHTASSLGEKKQSDPN